MIINIKNDLLKQQEAEAIAHCANCFCTMGSGIAFQIKNKIPEAYASDLKTIKGDKSKLGSFSFSEIKNFKENLSIKYVYNLYGQYYYGRDSRKLNYEAIYTAIELMRNDCMEKNIKTVGFPKNMGCMLAGGNWQIVSKMIEVIYENTPITVYICEYTI